MDEMKLKLRTKFMRGIVSKLISRAIFKKTGYKIDIQFNEIELENDENEMIRLHADVEAKIDKDEFKKLVKGIGLDD